jgi:hypothetical protein
MKTLRWTWALLGFLNVIRARNKKKKRPLTQLEYQMLFRRYMQREHPELIGDHPNLRRPPKRKRPLKVKNTGIQLSAKEIYQAHLQKQHAQTNKTHTGYEAYPWLDELLK